MPTLRELVKQMRKVEAQSDNEPGAYPIIFKDDWTKIKFVMLLRWDKFWQKVKRLCHL